MRKIFINFRIIITIVQILKRLSIMLILRQNKTDTSFWYHVGVGLHMPNSRLMGMVHMHFWTIHSFIHLFMNLQLNKMQMKI